MKKAKRAGTLFSSKKIGVNQNQKVKTT